MTAVADTNALPLRAPPITAHQAATAARALDEEEAKRSHLVIALTGAHAYGFPSPDSDLDLKGVHVLPTSRLVGLSKPAEHASRLEVIDGVEIDYASNELGQVLSGLVRGYGSYYERLLGMWILRTTAAHASLRPLVEGSFSRRVFAHYRGFATGQLAEAMNAGAPTAKKLLYVLRTALTGTHLLRTGKLVTDLTQLMDEHGFADATELLEVKRQGERSPLPEPMASRWKLRAAGAVALVEAAHDSSPLPEEAPNVAELEAWLIEERRRRF
jgi:predicted nucleotidyltransferase